MVRVSIVVGTRPQIIKSQPIITELKKKRFDYTVIHTGQHYDYAMSRSFFKELTIQEPDYNLKISQGSSNFQLANIILKLDKLLTKLSPDYVLVPGDTRSALAAAISVNRLGFNLGHIEAGARSYQNYMEEEINRRLIDHCSDYLFAPTKTCYKNLKNEKVIGKTYFSGDTMYDVFLNVQRKLNLKRSKKQNKRILVTIHRRENIEQPTRLKMILKFLNSLKKDWEITFPIHPHTRKKIRSQGLKLSGLNLKEPLKYSDILRELFSSQLLITDSGGLQKEAYWAKTNCVTIRENTEWVETLKHKNNLLLDRLSNSSLNQTVKKINSNLSFNKIKSKPFGNGNASRNIISKLVQLK